MNKLLTIFLPVIFLISYQGNIVFAQEKDKEIPKLQNPFTESFLKENLKLSKPRLIYNEQNINELKIKLKSDPVIKNMYEAIRIDAYEILDTSVIIDGRITDVCEVGFMEGTFILPQFILQELQNIADSSDSLRRARGRRGLDVLQKIQKMSNITVRIVDQDFPKIKEVDSKLVALARLLGGKIITNDFNLSKVAQLQGVTVLNFNELANSLKPIVLPGESMNIFIVKEGKESTQGGGYLDDGTMVVVDNARKLINKKINAVVTSVLQTTAGRMIFAKLREDADREELKMARR